MGRQYNKALFTLSYLVSMQLRKYMELFNKLTKMRVQDLQDPDIMKQKQEQIQKSLDKFKKHFTVNLDALNLKELHKSVSPKFTVCFLDLASYLNISLRPIVESQESVQSSGVSQYDRQQPSVIKEEEENEGIEDGEEEASVKLDANRNITPDNITPGTKYRHRS